MRGKKLMSPRTAQILDKTLSRWRQWDTGLDNSLAEQPKVIQQLLGGLTNQTFLAASGDFRAAVRVNAANTGFLGIDRDREQLLLKALQSSGCVPKLFIILPISGYELQILFFLVLFLQQIRVFYFW